MKAQFEHSHMSPKWFFSCFNILLWGTLYFPEIRVSCICENVSLVGHYMKIAFKCSEPLLKMGWASHRQISCENNPVLEPQRSRCLTEQLPSSAVTPRSLLLSCDHVLCISYPDAHDWGQMFSTLNVACPLGLYAILSVMCSCRHWYQRAAEENFPMQCSCK